MSESVQAHCRAVAEVQRRCKHDVHVVLVQRLGRARERTSEKYSDSTTGSVTAT